MVAADSIAIGKLQWAKLTRKSERTERGQKGDRSTNREESGVRQPNAGAECMTRHQGSSYFL